MGAGERAWEGSTNFDLGPKIKHQESGRLVLQSPRWEPMVAMVVSIVMLPTLLIGNIIAGSSRLTCDRPAFSTTHCQVTRFFGPGLIPLRSIELGSLTDVQVVREMRSSDGVDYWVYDVQLTGTKTTTRLRLYGNRDIERAQRITDNLQRFLANPARSRITITTGDTLEHWTFTLVSIGSLMIAIALLRRKGFRFEFDRLSGTLQIFGANGRLRRQISLREIQSIVIEQSTLEGEVVGRIVFVMQSGDRLPLMRTYSSGLPGKQLVAEAIREFLKLPPVEMD